MQDGDAADGEGEGDDDLEPEVEGDGDENEDQASQSGASQASDAADASAEQTRATGPAEPEAADELPMRPTIRPEIIAAPAYDIVPTIAAPQSTSVNAVTGTADTHWVFSGGSDGYIRRYNWADSVNSKLMLTVAQRHPFVDSVVKAGVLMSYWENWDSRAKGSSQSGGGGLLSPVYSLAVQSQGLWLLSGTESGTIRLQSIRHDEGKEIALLQQHTSAVSVLTLSSDERSLLSGSWDKSVLDWDLNVGKVRTTFASAASQVSSIEPRPISSVPVPVETNEQVIPNGTYSSNNSKEATLPNGTEEEKDSAETLQDEPPVANTPDSLFGGDDGDDDLFGDSGGAVMSNDGPLQDAFGEDEETSQLLPNGAHAEDLTDVAMQDAAASQPLDSFEPSDQPDITTQTTGATEGGHEKGESTETAMTNGLPRVDAMEEISENKEMTPEQQNEAPLTLDSTFMATSIDGSIRIWDRRQASPVARVQPRNTPPWCLSACWSPDGNHIYAGRRNGTVEEYDLRKGLRGPERVFKFPLGSGPVTAVRAMPNGRHLIWYV